MGRLEALEDTRLGERVRSNQVGIWGKVKADWRFKIAPRWKVWSRYHVERKFEIADGRLADRKEYWSWKEFKASVGRIASYEHCPEQIYHLW